MLHSSAPKNRTVVRSKNAVRLTKAALQTAYVLSDNLGASFAERLFTSPRRHARPDREQAVLASGRRSTVTVPLRSPRWRGGTIDLATWRWGHGPAVLLVHGWEGRGSQLGAFVAPLVAAGLSVVTFDAPGHGDSPDHRLYLTDLADSIEGIAAATGQLHGIIAHSFGAAGVLLAHSRNNVATSRNVMISPNVIIDDAIAKFARMVGLDDGDRATLEARMVSHTGVPLESLRLDNLVDAEVRGERGDSLLVIHDIEDREVKIDHGQALARAWPNARLLATTGLGHRRILRDGAVIAAAVEVLREGVQPPISDLVREVDRQLESP